MYYIGIPNLILLFSVGTRSIFVTFFRFFSRTACRAARAGDGSIIILAVIIDLLILKGPVLNWPPGEDRDRDGSIRARRN